MFGLDGSELAIIAVVALLVIGPKDLPRVLRMVGQWVGKARGMTRHVRTGFDAMMREAELDEMQKQWDAQNAAIMAGTTVALPDTTYADPVDMLPLPPPKKPSRTIGEGDLDRNAEADPPRVSLAKPGDVDLPESRAA